MNYPEQLLPQQIFKQITSDLSGYFICRKVFDKQLLTEPLPPIIPDEILSLETANDCFDYSTNLPGVFELLHNCIEHIGERKKYFRTYWDFVSDVEMPVYEQDFTINEKVGFFFLRIGSLQGLRIPFNKKADEKPNDMATAQVLHTPTNSNFWHFSVRWFDKEGNQISSNSAKWKNGIIAAARAMISELILLEYPAQAIPEDLYIKN